MQVRTAKKAGFCFGVERAVALVLEQCKKQEGPVYTYGPIIHNVQVVQDLEAHGVQILTDLDELDMLPPGKIVIRSHGVARDEQERLDKSVHTVVDATCPFVKKIHHLVAKAGQEGKTVLLAGDPDHPEVKGIIGWTCGPSFVVQDTHDAEKLSLPEGQNILLVAQTTFQAGKFEELVEFFTERGYDNFVINTVCNATDERQAEARQLACQVDSMIVVGGSHSSNTRKLYEICKEHCGNVYLIETLDDLDLKPFQSFSRVGITAGASTPKSIIEEVTKHVRTKL